MIFALVLLPETASAQRGSGRHQGGHSVRAGGRQTVIVGQPVVRDTIIGRAVVKPNVIVRQPLVAGSVPAGSFGRIGFGTVSVRTGFGTVPVRTGFEVAPVGNDFVHTGTGFVHTGTGFVGTHRVPGAFVHGRRDAFHGRRDAFAQKSFRTHRLDRRFGGAVVGYPVYPYYPYLYSPYPYAYSPEYGYQTSPNYYPPQTYGGDYGAGGVTAGLSTYFMDLGNQNQSGLTFEVWPATAEIFVDGIYVGTVQDFSADREPLIVVSGTHRILLQAPGYRAAALAVTLAQGQVTPYYGELQPLQPY